MVISSRTPEGSPNHCPVCGSEARIEPSDPAGDAPCPQCGQLLWFTSEEVGDALVIKPTRATLRADELTRLVDHVLTRPGMRLVFDLGEVQYISSTVLGKLLILSKKISSEGGKKLKLKNLHPGHLEVFRITRLGDRFDLDP